MDMEHLPIKENSTAEYLWCCYIMSLFGNTSAFVQTISTMGVMIAFAFVSRRRPGSWGC